MTAVALILCPLVFAWCWNQAERAGWWIDDTTNEGTEQ